MESNNEKLNFKVSSALKDLIGRDLIHDGNIAVFELVKNSYDAYAKKVLITFEKDKITIADNGKGMTYDDLINKWLFLAYSAKKDGTEDNNKQKSYRDNINRHYAGAKGVGRFSCDRLGENLVLTTCSKESGRIEQLIVDWKKFEINQSSEFTEIPVEHNVLSNSNFFDESSTGTILEITNLREEWGRNKILKLKGFLEKLINPFEEIQDFQIEIKCEDEGSNDENIKKASGDIIFDKDVVNGVIKNSISQVISLRTTKIEVVVKKDKIFTTLTDRDKKIYELEQINTFNKLQNVTINLYYLNKSAKDAFSKLMGIPLVQYGSIFLFRNGFRIFPFGEPKDDSWKLDQRAQQGYKRFLGTRDLFGRVDVISNDIEEFRETSSRDSGLVETEGSLQLFSLFDMVERRLERYVAGVLWGEGFLKREYFINKEIAQKEREGLNEEDKCSDSADYVFNSSVGSKIDFANLIKTLSNDKEITIKYYNKDLLNIFPQPTLFDDVNIKVLDDLETIADKTKDSDLMKAINNAKEKIQELENKTKIAESTISDLQIKLDESNEKVINAERNEKIAKIKQEKAEKRAEVIRTQNLFLMSDMNQDVKQLQSLQHQVYYSCQNINEWGIKSMSDLAEGNIESVKLKLEKIVFENQKNLLLSNMICKVNFNTKTEEIKDDLVAFVKEYVQNIYKSQYRNKMFLKLRDTNIKFKILFSPLEIMILIDNLIINSFKAKATEVFINWFEDDRSISLIFSDNGCGIQEDIIDKIFEYRVSTTGGAGIGLYFVKKIIDNLGAEIEVFNEDGAKFVICFKK